MNHHIFHMPLHELGTALGIGVVLGLIYMYLLWMTVQTLLKVKHKGLFLFISAVLRIFLLIFGALALSHEHAGRFILIFCGVILARLFILRFTKMGAYHTVEQKELVSAMKPVGRNKKKSGTLRKASNGRRTRQK